MKTKNNNPKAKFKTLTVIVGLVLISITLNAQDVWNSFTEKNSFNELAMVDNNFGINHLKANSAILTNVNTLSELIEETVEEALELKAWMINEALFVTGFMFYEEETDEPLELEEWMMEETNFSNSTFEIMDETEDTLELEDWMLNEELFDTTEEGDEPLELETWMTNDKLWI